MNKYKSKLPIIVVLICFLLLSGVWYFFKKNASDTMAFKYDVPAETPDHLPEPTPTSEPKKNSIKVYIIGEVSNPGVYEMEEGARIEDVVNAAGGFTDMAYDRSVNLAAKVSDEQQIIIYNKDEADKGIVSSSQNGDNINSAKININKATEGELTRLTGIGEAKAKNIVQYREENGNFTSVEQIKNVDGIGDKLFEDIKDDITIR